MKSAYLASALAMLAEPVMAQPVEPISDLIRGLTNQTTQAGQRGDQATLDRLTDDAVLFSSGDGTAQRDAKLDVIGAVAVDLQALTERCHSRSVQLRSCTAPGALLIDETGASNAASDVSGASIGDGKVEDFVVHRTGAAVITSFTLHTAAAKVLAVEIWIRGRDRWTLVGGQAIPLNQDPPVMKISTESLGDYAGIYTAGPGSLVIISKDGNGLSAATDDGKPTKLEPEARDVFFTPALPAGYLRPVSRFHRGADGRVVGYVRSGVQFKRVDASPPGLQASPPVAGPLILRDFMVHCFGDIAVATFFHDRTTPYHGQMLHQTYRSMEAWSAQSGTWKMISSQGRQL